MANSMMGNPAGKLWNVAKEKLSGKDTKSDKQSMNSSPNKGTDQHYSQTNESSHDKP